jgi:serine/threonine-protein kinase
MPPEQLSGDLVDERTDVFSLGVVCYQALTGTAPFVATTPEASEKLIERGAAPLDTTEPELAGACSDAIDSALDPNPAGRMSSVTELADDMVDQLGDPAEGRTSLADLMGQLTDDEQESESWREFERAPLAERAPWLPGILLRALTACACATAAARIAPGLSLDTTTAVWALCAGCALAGAILPPLGSALVLVGLVVAIGLAGVYTSAFLVASLVAVAGVAWWAVFGRTRGLAAASLLLPCCVMVPEAGVALAAWGLSPAAALATGAFGWLLEGVLSVCIGSSFAAGAIFEGCAALITMSTTWVCALGCGLSACAGAALCQRGTKAATLGGQALTAGCLVAVRLVCARVENGGIWVAPNWASLGIALLFSLLMVLVTVVLGPPQPIREDD